MPRTIATCIQQFCYSYGVSIEHDIDVPLLREGDQFLMPLFQHPNFLDNERYIINKCRIYLRILTVAEMTSGNGKMINVSIWEGTQPHTNLQGYDWPVQGRPRTPE